MHASDNVSQVRFASGKGSLYLDRIINEPMSMSLSVSISVCICI